MEQAQKKKIDLQNKVRKVSRILLALALNIDINNAITKQLKGKLFEIYSRSGNIEAYNNINTRTIAYRNKIIKGISKEEYILRERMLQLKDEFKACYKLNKLETRGTNKKESLVGNNEPRGRFW